jgi:homoprotocatechuate degradation regulator HpaR
MNQQEVVKVLPTSLAASREKNILDTDSYSVEIVMHESLTIALLQARETAMSWFRPVLNRHNLTEQQWRVIRILAVHRSLDFHQLASEACILRPSLTGILTRLERDGLVWRMKPVSDQRKLFASLTPRGEALYQEASHQVEQGYREIERQFGPEKMAQLQGLLYEFSALPPPPDDA